MYLGYKKVLHLTLHKKAFEALLRGKLEEIRKPSDWIKSRLYNKDGSEKKYDYIKFVNGYGKRPTAIVPYVGFKIAKCDFINDYGNNFIVDIKKDDLIIIYKEPVSVTLYDMSIAAAMSLF